MFYDGDLQSGISLALQSSKSVACFVRDESEESAQWENEWLFDDRLVDVLPSRAILLRIDANTQEAGFLSAFCPINSIPTLAIINNGQLRDSITGSVTQDEFISRVLKAVGAVAVSANKAEEHPPVGHTDDNAGGQAQALTPPSSNVQPQPSSSTISEAPQVHQSTSSTSPSSAAEGLRAERASRLAAQRQLQDLATPFSSGPDATSNTSRDRYGNRHSYLEQQRQRQIEARQERERIMVQIEADKAERRARERDRKREAEMARQVAGEGGSSSTLQSPMHQESKRHHHASSDSRLSVRLLDGATIRHVFPSTAKLDPDIRSWISSQSPDLARQPYTFKQILAPGPARTLSMSDERTELRELGLIPSATLVLMPLQKGSYVEAYSGASSPGWGLLSLPYSAASGALGLVSSGVGAVAGALGWGVESDSTAAPNEQVSSASAGSSHTVEEDGKPQPQTQAQRSNIRIRTLADQRAQDRRREQEFYNGNQTNFQSTDDRGDT